MGKEHTNWCGGYAMANDDFRERERAVIPKENCSEHFYDPHLTPLFQICSDEDLIPLRDYILKAMTNELEIAEEYQSNPDRPMTYINELVYEIRTFGGNTIANLWRGDGISYEQIVKNVAKTLKVTLKGPESVPEIECKILDKVLEKVMEKMSQEDKERFENALREELKKAGLKNVDLKPGIPIVTLLAQLAAKEAGFVTYKVALIVANSLSKKILGRGLTLAANAMLPRAIAAFTGPIGVALSALFTAISIAGPAHRVVIPCVCHVAYLRSKKDFQSIS